MWLIMAIALLASCADDDDASPTASTPSTMSPPPATQQATVPDATTSTTTSTTTTSRSTTTTLPTTTGLAPDTSVLATASCSEAPTFDPDGALRDQFLAYLVTCGFSQPEAACLFDHLDFTDPAVVAGDPGAMMPAFQECHIDADRMAEIGGA